MPRPHLQPHPCSLKLAPCPHPSANLCPERGEEPDSPFPKREGGWGFRFPHANPTLPPRPSRRRRGCLPAHPPSSALFDCVLRCSMGIAYGRASTFVVVWLLPKAETGLAPVTLFSLAPILSLADYKPGRLGYTEDERRKTKDGGRKTKDRGSNFVLRPWSSVLRPWSLRRQGEPIRSARRL